MPVVGPFSIKMDVVDGAGASLRAISTGMAPAPRHIVSVKNITTLPYGVAIAASLPNRMLRLAFTRGGVAADAWSDARHAIPPRSSRDLECSLKKVARGSATFAEPIQCDQVHRNRGSGPFVLCPAPPFDITVGVM